MASFKVGDRVVIVRSEDAARIGTVTTIIGDERPARPTRICLDGRITPSLHPMVYELDIWTPRGPAAYPREWLEPYRDDDHEKAEWTDELRRLCQVGKVDA